MKDDILLQFFQALADEDRLRIAGSLASAPRTIEELSRELRLKPNAVVRHLQLLKDAGLVNTIQRDNRQTYQLDHQHLQRMKSDVLAIERGETPDLEEGSEAWQRKVLHDFFDGETLKTVPATYSKRMIVYQWLSERFETGRRYPEREVNEILQEYHPDFALLRRDLVDNGFMSRERGIYQRVEQTPS